MHPICNFVVLHKVFCACSVTSLLLVVGVPSDSPVLLLCSGMKSSLVVSITQRCVLPIFCNVFIASSGRPPLSSVLSYLLIATRESASAARCLMSAL